MFYLYNSFEIHFFHRNNLNAYHAASWHLKNLLSESQDYVTSELIKACSRFSWSVNYVASTTALRQQLRTKGFAKDDTTSYFIRSDVCWFFKSAFIVAILLLFVKKKKFYIIVCMYVCIFFTNKNFNITFK